MLTRTSVLLLALGLMRALYAQEQTRLFVDEFDATTPSRVASSSNVVIDRLRGEVRLAFYDSTVTTPANYQLFLNGIESAYNGQRTIRTVVDIDALAGDPNSLLVTDAGTNTVFIYDRATGAIGTTIALSFSPRDAFSYRENGRLKILIVGFNPADGIGRVVKYDIEAFQRVEWEYKTQNQSLQLNSPSDVFVYTNAAETNHPNQVLICDTGNQRLVAVDTIATNDSKIQILQGSGIADFGRPVDLEGVPAERDVLLVTDQSRNRVVLVQRNGASLTEIWHFGSDSGLPDSTQSTLNSPSDADAVRASSGNILISDAGNNRIMEVNRQKNVVFCYGRPRDNYCFGRALFGLTDADRNGNRRTLAAFKDANLDTEDTVPRTLAYSTQAVMSQVFSFRRAVDFDSLIWAGLDGVAGGLFDSTRIRLQMRSSNNPSNFQLSAAQFPFFGPDSVRDFYEQRRTAINRRHDGDSLFQFLIHLETSNPQHTPVLTSITATGKFFRTKAGDLLSVPFGAPVDSVVTDWVSLTFPTRGSSVRVEIIDATNNNSLVTFPETDNTVVGLTTLVPALRGKQRLRLRATLRTTESFLSNTTPILESWRIEYKLIPKAPSQTSFTDASFKAVNLYKPAGVPQDSVFVSVIDASMIQFLNQFPNGVPVTIKSTLTEDSVNVTLKPNPTNVANFRGGVPIAFRPSRTNDTLEVKDRDVLVVRYRDPIDGNADVSTDTARVIRRTSAQIRIENLAGVEIDSIFIDNYFVVRVTGEKDQDLNPVGKDTLQARVYVDRANGEEETLRLIETGDTTGVFLSLSVQVNRERPVAGDRKLRTFNLEDVVAEYVDPDNNEKVLDVVKVFGADEPIDSLFAADGLFDFMIAPNPYRTYQHSVLKLAAKVRSGKTLTLDKVEVFNLASEKVSTIPGGQILFSGSTMVTGGPSVMTTNWWNRQNDAGSLVASGTYFVKFHARITDNTTQRTDSATLIRKLVLVQ